MSDRYMEFLGVTTKASWVHRVFDSWTECLGERLFLSPIDLPLKAGEEAYRDFVTQLRDKYPNNRGALITSHKAGVFDSAADLFDSITPIACQLGEVGMVYWRRGQLIGDANDVLSTTQVCRKLLSSSQGWRTGSRAALILGGGGAAMALTYALASDREVGCRGVTISEVDPARVSTLKKLVSKWDTSISINIVQTSESSDDLVATAQEGTLIANATGLGKDRLGSPVSPDIVFPGDAIVWDFNYRFAAQDTPNFLEIASAQAEIRGLTIEDGWDYFVWGWLGVMCNVLGLPARQFHRCFLTIANSVRHSIHASTA